MRIHSFVPIQRRRLVDQVCITCKDQLFRPGASKAFMPGCGNSEGLVRVFSPKHAQATARVNLIAEAFSMEKT